jgi:hypothetical protein
MILKEPSKTEQRYRSSFSLGVCPALVDQSADSLSAPPHLVAAMTKVLDFVAGLARSGKSAAEIKPFVDAAFGDKALGLTSIYYIMKEVQAVESTDDQHNLSVQKIKRTADIVAAMATNIAEDGLVTCKEPWGLQWNHL